MQSEPGAQNPARGGDGPGAPNGPNGPLCGRRRRAKRGASCARQCNKGVSDFRRFGAAEKAVWPHGARWDRRPLGLAGPELTLTGRYSDWLGVPTYEPRGNMKYSNIEQLPARLS
eukprot:14050379-Alexandrium_andersonii.AAC.1